MGQADEVTSNRVAGTDRNPSRLTPREREVFDLITRGETNKHAARTLGCTERTVKAHRQRVMEKIGVKTLPELVSFAERVWGRTRCPLVDGCPRTFFDWLARAIVLWGDSTIVSEGLPLGYRP